MLKLVFILFLKLNTFIICVIICKSINYKILKNIYKKSIKIVDNMENFTIFVLSSRILEWVPTESA